MSQIIKLSEGASVSMHDQWFEIADKNHFWMKARYEVFKKYFQEHIPKKSKILEIGCGNGILREQLESLGYTVDGCDLNLYALEKATAGKGKLFCYNIYDLNSQLIKKYDLVILADIIEHIEDDNDFIVKSLNHLKDNGKILINVPAHQYLYSKFDKNVGHIRRYSKQKIENLLRSSSLTKIRFHFWGFFLMPVAFARKIILTFKSNNIIDTGYKPSSEFINKALDLITNLEIKLFNKVPTGTSIMVLATKNTNNLKP